MSGDPTSQPSFDQASNDPAQAASVLDRLPLAACVIDRAEHRVWSNAALAAYPGNVADAIRQACAGLADELANSHQAGVRRRALTVGNEHFFELTAGPWPNPVDGSERAIVLVSDNSLITRLREKIDAIDSAGRRLMELDADASGQLEIPERLRLLEENVLRYCADLLSFEHLVVRVLDPHSGRLEAVLAGGLSEQATNTEMYARKEGSGICGYVAATGQSFICDDVASCRHYLPGLESAGSSLTVPLRLGDRVVGVLNAESDRPAAFSEEDRQVAEIFGRYIAAALQVLKLLVAEHSEAADQVATDVRGEVAEPLNDIVAEVTRLMMEAALPPEARPRLEKIIELVDQVHEAMHTATESPTIRGLSTTEAKVVPALRGKRVLIADDEDIIREAIADVLSRAGARPVMARDGTEAIAMIDTQRFDLVLSDIKMPNGNGYEVFAAVKAVNPECPVILITGFGYDPEHSIVRASHEGLAGVLFKPFQVEQLLETISKAVALDAG